VTRLRALYLHPAAAYGGASKSLIELFEQLRTMGVEGTVLTPRGSASIAFDKAGLQIETVKGLSQFDNTRYGHYRRQRWIILLRELFLLPFSLLGLWRIRHQYFDLIHVNEITLLPLGLIAKWMFHIPMVVHVRSLQRKPSSGWRTQLINAWLHRHADAVIAIDGTVANTLEPSSSLRVIHNGLRIGAANVAIQKPSTVPVDQPTLRVGFFGVLIPLKGIYELVEAVRILKNRNIQIECLVAGENARELSRIKGWILSKLGFARDVRAELEDLITRYGLQKQVRLIGFVSDVRTLYPQIDVLCFPSHLDAAGRPVFESAFYGIPSVVAITNPLPDAVMHGVTGIAIPKPDPVLIANALQQLAQDSEYRVALGYQARDWACKNFAIESSSAAMLNVYQQLLSSCPSEI
jgi:glycosyltransferase involved in cell wall biosynthesis